MRVRLLSDTEDRVSTVMEIQEASYEGDLFSAEDKGRPGECVEGLLMFDMEENMLYIPNISLGTCEAIVSELFEKGCADLRKYGEYEYLDDDDDDDDEE